MDNNIITTKESQVLKRTCSRNFLLLLYPDNEGHAKALAKVAKKYDYTYILHDKDNFEDDTDMHDEEQLKKAHYHCIIHLPSQREKSMLCRELGVEPRFIQRVSDRTSCLCYLLHVGYKDKFQYSIKEVISSRPSLIREALSAVENNTERYLKIADIIQNKNCTTVSFAMKMLAQEGYIDFALKHFSVIKALVDELWEERKISAMHYVSLGELIERAKSDD